MIATAYEPPATPSAHAWTRACALACALAMLALPAMASAQTPAPLRKSDLVHYLSSNTYSQAEIAGIVRRSCLAFAPTARDRDDLVALGATDDVMSAIDACARNREERTTRPRARSTPASEPAPAPSAPLQLVLPQSSVSASAGSVVSVVAEVRRGDKPVDGVRLVLRGTDRIPGGTEQPLAASTDASGRAVFPLPVGNRAGTYYVTVESLDGLTLRGDGGIVVTTRPAARVNAEVSPAVLQLTSGTPSRVEVRVTLHDPFGNPAALQRVELRPAHPVEGLAALSATTSDSGVARFELPTTPLHGNDSLVVVVADQTVGVLPVSAAGEVASLMLRAARLEADGRPTAAEAVYDTVLQADPDNVRALLGRGAVRSLAGKHQAARADFLAVLRADPDNAAALTGLGYSYARSGEYAKAEEQFQRALRASPKDDDAATGLAYAALWRYDPRQAVHRFDVLSAFRPTSYPADAAAKFRAGVEHMRQGKLANAQYDFTAAIAAAPSWPDAYYNRALVYEAEGWPERARPDLEKYLQLRPAASNRDEIVAHVDALRIGNPGAVFKRGLIVPGLGQLSTGRPAVGLVVLAGVAGSAVWAFSTSTELEERTFTDPFNQKYTDLVPVRRRPHVVEGVALAGAVWLLGAAEAYLHARHALSEGPELPESGGRAMRSSAAGTRLLPVVSWRPSGPAFGAGITIPFR